jgi:ribose 5-phosphate isomerase
MEAMSADEKIVAQRSNSLAVLIAETKKKNALAEQHFACQF